VSFVAGVCVLFKALTDTNQQFMREFVVMRQITLPPTQTPLAHFLERSSLSPISEQLISRENKSNSASKYGAAEIKFNERNPVK